MIVPTKAGACPHRDGRTCTECERLSESARMLLRRMNRLSELKPSTAIPVLPRLGYGGRLTLLTGRESSGKSTLLRVAVACASIGKDWMTDEPIQPVPAIWIGEERRDDIKAEFACFEDLQMNQDLVRVASVADVHDVSDLHDVIRSIGAKVVVIDPVADLITVRTAGNTYREMRQALLALRPLEPDVAVIGVLHSARRSTDSVSSYIGSAGQGGACDLLLDFTNPQQGGDDSYRLLKVSKSRCRAAQVQGTLYPLSFDGLRYREADEPRAPTRGKDVPTEADVRAYLRENPGTGKTAMARHFGITPGGSSAYRSFSARFDGVRDEPPTTEAVAPFPAPIRQTRMTTSDEDDDSGEPGDAGSEVWGGTDGEAIGSGRFSPLAPEHSVLGR